MADTPAKTPLQAKIDAAKAAVAGKPPVGAPQPEPQNKAPEAAPVVATGEKLYHHRFHGANFVMPDGRVITFLGGIHKTSKPDVIAELDKVANVPGSFIHTTPSPVIARDESQLRKDMVAGATATFDEVNKIPAGATTVAMPMAPTQVSTLAGDGAVTEKPA